MIHLSRRLQRIFDHLVEGEPVWDLCCDHGLLGQRALESGRFSAVHFVDRVPEIVAALQQRLESEGVLLDSASFHGVDAENLPEPLHGTVAIAGVGGPTTLEILRLLEGRGALRATRLVLSIQTTAQTFPERFAQQLGPAGWRIVSAELVKEGPRQRPVWVAERAPVT